ncbi:MAG TPA: hypothetical protein VN832_07335 [Stellaceae bacterium]|nr:hypothetical protein [Stellaceae bacterium]
MTSERLALAQEVAESNRERIVSINRINIRLAGTQGVLQIATILVMAKFVS